MATIMLVEDQPVDRDVLERGMVGAGHIVHAVEGKTTEDFIRGTMGWFNEDLNRTADILVLDIKYFDDKLGGVLLHRALVEAGLRRRFGHVLIPTIYYQGNSFHDGAVRAFAITSWIPRENLFPKDLHNLKPLLDRISQVTGKQPEAWSRFQ